MVVLDLTASLWDSWLVRGVVALALPLVILVVVSKVRADPRRKRLPKGPPGHWLWRNTFDLDGKTGDNRERLIKWAKEYGELVYMNIAGRDYIWLSSAEATKELIDKKSAIYSSRPRQPMAFEQASGSKRIVMMQYGNEWRKLRQIMHKMLMPKSAQSYKPIELLEAQQLSIDLMDDPDHFLMHHRRFTCSTMFNITYGRRLPTWDCPEVEGVFKDLDGFTSIQNPGEWLVDAFPALEHLPEWMVQNWRTAGQKIHAHEKQLWMGLWNQLKADVADGTAPQCFAKDFLNSDWREQGIDELQAAYINGTMIEAGTDTTAITLNQLMLQLALHPEVVARAHEELDRVIGPSRTPTWEDEPSLPYIRSIIKEIMRYRPITKSGMLHMVTEDDEYKGYFIPKDTIIMISWFAIHFDERRYPEPYKFKPERFIDYKLSAAEYAAHPDVSQRDHFGYGAGRRICIGMHVAEQGLFIAVSRLLWGFDVKKRIGSDGREIIPDENSFHNGIMSEPNDFEIDLKVRTKQHERVFREEWEKADKSARPVKTPWTK